jgi:hypothetical protein
MTRLYRLGADSSANWDGSSSADVNVNSNNTFYLTYAHTTGTTSNERVGTSNAAIRGNFSISSGVTATYAFISTPGYPGSDSWSTSGTETVKLNIVVTSADLDARVRILRVNSSGTAQDTGSWTSYQTMSADRTFNPTKPTWGTTAITDRLALEIEFVDTRGHGGSISHSFSLCGLSDSGYFQTQVDTPDTDAYEHTYYLTNNASDLSTYADGNYDMDGTGESSSTTFLYTGLADAASKTIGFITPAGTPNNTDWSGTTEHMVLLVELAAGNDSSIGDSDGVQLVVTAERLNSSGTLQESASAAVSAWSRAVINSISSTTYALLGLSVPNKVWASASTGDRLALKMVLTNSMGETADIGMRIHTGSSQTGILYSKIPEGAAGAGPILLHAGVI